MRGSEMTQQSQQFSPLGRDRAANFSPPPCGEGSAGVGVARCGTSVPYDTTPHPNPPPREVGSTRLRHQTGSKSDKSDFDWGRESNAALQQPNFGRLALRLVGILAIGTTLAGCGRCGDFVWSSLGQIGACHSDAPARQ
jgi:hypothetical protein